jgi:hypothetical protein
MMPEPSETRELTGAPVPAATARACGKPGQQPNCRLTRHRARQRMGVAEELQTAQGLLASGDFQGLLRYLRTDGEALPLGEVARLVAGAARLAGFEDLAQAAAAGGDGAEDARRCTTSATRALSAGPATWRSGRWRVRSSWRRTPGPVLSEPVAALEQDGQHARTVAVLQEHEPVLAVAAPVPVRLQRADGRQPG